MDTAIDQLTFATLASFVDGSDSRRMIRDGNPMAIVCSHCGSRNVSRDAWSRWDEVAQEWVLRTVFDYSYCHHCDCERSLEELPVRPPANVA